ncbi:hypothetical protein [Hyalangium minutum]|uniref:Uncharacterized protein n=1 Tax=Hyalangium minutum TaxID=394096 RepID=A0A085WKH0_9BACT|nr:hypothetical protein [Hyalangium minutum]KFE68183.1 hypothetical protein DB31_7420 [Hyalangium minutum]
MKRSLLWVLCALLPACALFRRPPRPVHAPPQEAAGVTFPAEPLDIEGNVTVTGPLFVAMQLAMEDFRPWDLQPPKDATPREVCLSKRESYDMIAAPGPEGLVFVQIWLRPEACEGPIALDTGASYAIDAKTWRILAIRQ